jgi:membrane protease YdiL (CAAX protease family)
MSFIPILVLLRLRHQSFEPVGFTKKSWRFSISLGLIFSLLWFGVGFTFSPQSIQNLLTLSVLFGNLYFLAGGFGEALLFRDFLQTHCTAWLGNTKGLFAAKLDYGFCPYSSKNLFVQGMNPTEALFSCVLLLPVSLLLGLIFLRTQNILGSTILHTTFDLVGII